MSIASDPRLRATARAYVPLANVDPESKPVVPEFFAQPARRSMRTRVAVYAMLGTATIALVLRGLASLVAAPLVAAPLVSSIGGVAPAWMIEVTTTSSAPTTALLYGRDVGVQLVRVPPRRGSVNEPRLVPARLAKGEVHFVSLDFTPLHVHAASPKGAQVMSFDATGHIITAFHKPREIGVRVGW